MVIVAGHLVVAASDRDTFVERSREAVRIARGTEGCFDFVVAADPIEANRVCIYERWTGRETLKAFRGQGPSDDLGSMIESYAIKEFEL